MSLHIHLSAPLASASGGMRSDADSVVERLYALIAKRPGHPPLPPREDARARFVHLERSGLAIALLLTPCFQVGVEIERAFARGIPILFVAWGRPSFDGVHPQLSGFPPHEEYAQGIEPLILGEEWAAEAVRELERLLDDPALLKTVTSAAEKRLRPRLSTHGIPEM